MESKRSKSWLIKHNGSHENLYRRWSDMKTRCNNKNNCNYKHYGGRGISVCEEWDESYESFRDWSLENGYLSELSIDRIDVNGNYCPENCRWTDKSTQNSNRRIEHPYGYIGISKHSGKSCFYTRVKINNKCAFYYASKNLNECAIERNNFIVKNNLLYPLNDICESNNITICIRNGEFMEVSGDGDVYQVDTREKKNENIIKYFNKNKIKYIEKKLDVGDYMNVRNPKVIVDKKSGLDELAQNLCTKDSARFYREIRRSYEQNIKLIILIESCRIRSIDTVNYWSSKYSKISGKRLQEEMYKIAISYGVQWEFCSKQSTGKRIVELLSN